LAKAEKIFLVSCVAGKRPDAAPAANLYTSAWFIKARRLVEATGAPWFILSAEHGLVAPDTVISPYNRTLNTMGVSERRAWAERVRNQMEAELPDAEEIVLLAGLRYREHLMPSLQQRFRRVTVPMERLPIGRQLSWLTNVPTL